MQPGGNFRDVLAVSCSPQTQTCFPSLLGQANPSSPAFRMEFAAHGVCDSSSQHRDTLGRDLDGHIPLLPYPRATPPCSFPAFLLAPCSCQITLSAGRGAPAAPGIPLGISRAPKCHQPAGTGEVSALAGM